MMTPKLRFLSLIFCLCLQFQIQSSIRMFRFYRINARSACGGILFKWEIPVFNVANKSNIDPSASFECQAANKGLKIWVRVRDRILYKKSFSIISLQASHYRITCPTHSMSYTLPELIQFWNNLHAFIYGLKIVRVKRLSNVYRRCLAGISYYRYFTSHELWKIGHITFRHHCVI